MNAATVLAVIASLALSACGSVDVDKRVQAYREQQVHDLVAAYDLARGQSDLVAMCVKSNQVSAAYVDARDPSDASAWRSKSAQDCQGAREALAPMIDGAQGNRGR
jgi:hypothetical protein